MLTASSVQIRMNITIKRTQRIIRNSFFLTRCKMNWITIPAIKRSVPPTTKSMGFQLTSSVNCMAIRGIDKIEMLINAILMIFKLSFFIIE